jgi:sucrose synthase
MSEDLQRDVDAHRARLYGFFRGLVTGERTLLLRTDMVEPFERFAAEKDDGLRETRLARALLTAQEGVVRGRTLWLAMRPRVAQWTHLQIHCEEMWVREVEVAEYLDAKERAVNGGPPSAWPLEVDFGPFERGFPRLSEARSIGRGVEFLNRHLARRVFDDKGPGARAIFDFLRLHRVEGRPVMLNERIPNLTTMVAALRDAIEWIEIQPGESLWSDHADVLSSMGFEPGWGRTLEQARSTMELLVDVLEAPSPEPLERFLRRIPMIFKVAILSPHGWFGQADVLGKPDTGGQVVYILDQVRALEREMRHSIRQQGLDVQPQIIVLTRLIPESEGTTCDHPVEPILGTEHARIVRVPFRDENGEVLQHWISRFEIWPYLERYSIECEHVLSAEFGGRPDLVIGNYSDGNLVATLLSKRLKVTQCNIAHALEKTKYLHSDLYWRDHEDEHHFATQYSVDLMAMNSADFIITSTYQEIAGTRETVGQYESYQSYTLPGLYRVNNGIDPFDPKFNIVSPGAAEDVFFPYWEAERRVESMHDELDRMIFGPSGEDGFGHLDDRTKPILMTLSRLDRIKNVAGFVDWYAHSPELRERANVLVVGGFVDPSRSRDADERAQIERLHRLFVDHDLHGQVRWANMLTDKTFVGELYRYVADHKGVFVQPALFEAFGLTVIEAMVSGLPVFATLYGGPLEIIQDGRSGYHIDPNHGGRAARRMAEFFDACRDDPDLWNRMSRAAYERVQERYTWSLYAQRLLALSRVYGFWKYITNIEREETARYLDMFYGLMIRPLAAEIGAKRSDG